MADARGCWDVFSAGRVLSISIGNHCFLELQCARSRFLGMFSGGCARTSDEECEEDTLKPAKK